MRQAGIGAMRRGAALVCGLVLFLFLVPGSALGGLLNSRHDFTATGPNGDRGLATGGPCTPCHVPHKAEADSALWGRPIDRVFYSQDQTKSPNYLPETTILCYDCHDDGSSADNTPDPGLWDSSHKPQDVALSGTTLTGYYEKVNGELPAVPFPDPGAPTGGHYWQSEPTGSPTDLYEKGDKIMCGLCHDPHGTRTGSNEAFFLTETGNGAGSVVTLGNNLKASGMMSNGTGTGTGREMCAACHGYSPPNDNRKTFYGVLLPEVPDTVPEHADDAGITTPCVACHPHNRPAGCNDCHGYPPLETEAEAVGLFDRELRPDAESYNGGAGAHRRHRAALAALGTTIFNCEICHGPGAGLPTTAWHSESADGILVERGNVDLRGQTIYWGAGSSYNGTSSGGTGTYAFAAKGGPDGGAGGRCSLLECHGRPPNVSGALNWDDKMLIETGPAAGDFAPGGAEICKWCHDSTPARIDAGPLAPNMLGASNGGATAGGDWATGNTWGADVSGHGKASGNYDDAALGDGGGKAAANRECTECHDAAYGATGPNKTHFDGADDSAQKRLRDAINGLAVATADEACLRCHQNGAGGTAPEGTDMSMHGNDPAGGYSPIEPAQFSRTCRQCHNVHGLSWNNVAPTPRNLHMIGTWVDDNNNGAWDGGEEARVDSNATDAVTDITTTDRRVNFTRFGTPTTASGEDSFDDGLGDGQHESVCVVCHADLVNNHNEVTSTVVIGDPASQANHNPVGDDCTLCHNHDFDKGMATADAWMPSGCSGCHGSIAAGTDTQGDPTFENQFWPDGNAPVGLPAYAYADSDPGAHYRHVQALALQLYGQTPAQLVADASRQIAVCAFCHPDPGGGGHLLDDNTRDPASRVTVYLDADDTGAQDDVFRKLTVGAQASGLDVTGANGDQDYDYGSRSCANLVCHNQAATPSGANNWDVATPWAPANANCSDIACHATATYTIAHTTHVNGTKSYDCTECHADNSGNLQHGNGEVDMKWDNAGSFEASHGGNGFYDKNNNGAANPAPDDTGFEYKSGGALATNAAYARSCYRVYCHGGDNNATYPPDWRGSGNTPNVRSPVWNSAAVPLACSTCHAYQQALADSTARHLPHVANNAWLPHDCGSCHLAPTQTAPPAPPNNNLIRAYGSHVNGSVDLDLAVTYDDVTGDCTNSCHDVGAATPPESADPGDWLDANPLACTDCHSGTYIGTAPTSGLHDAAIAMAHDERFLATEAQAPAENATCTNCHLASGPSASHIDGPDNTATPENSTVATYSWNADVLPAWKLVAYDNTGYATGSTSCQATCHSDYRISSATGALDLDGLWRRRWVGVIDAKPVAVDNPGAGVCRNCHGDFTNGWNMVVVDANTSTTSHTDPYGGNSGDKMDRHYSTIDNATQCKTCHGWGYAGYDRSWDGAAPGHGDGSITMNGPDDPPGPPAGAEYDDATGGCAQACHGVALVLRTNSGWPANYGDFGSGACEGCHNGVQTQYPLAPNVMGDGTLPAGDPMHTTPQPFDDGAYGYNVNGHGRDGDTSTESHGDPIGVACTACHDIGVPAGTHLDGTLNGRLSPDTRNTNSFHLVTGFMTTSPPAEEWTAQVTFDNHCATATGCHPSRTSDMRHAVDTAGIHATPNVAEFGQYNSYAAPANNPPPWMFYDRHLMLLGVRDGEPNFALCVSCHNPHGSDIASSRNDGNNKMVIYKWMKPAKLCSKCHP